MDTPTPTPASPPRRTLSPPLRALLDAGPVVAFFGAYWRWDMFTATAALMVAASVALAVAWYVERKLAVVPLVALAFVLLFGALTLLRRDEEFIKLKVTAINALFGLILVGGLAFGRPLLKPMLGPVLSLSDAGWRSLCLRFGLFFFALAATNEILRRFVTTDVWVTVKLFGFLPAPPAFLMLQIFLLRGNSAPEERES